MELILQDAGGRDVAAVTAFDLDMAYGSDENDFELTLPADAPTPSRGWRVYMDGRPWGGIIDRRRSEGDDAPVWYGRTWHGVLAGKVVCPDAGADYLTLSGDAHDVIAAVLARVGLGGAFSVPPDPSGVTVSAYRCERYADAYATIRGALSASGARLAVSATSGGVELSAARVDQPTDEDASLARVTVDEDWLPVNHLVCLGKGELRDRVVVHLYADADGAVGQRQTLFGADERAEVYDYSSADRAKLVEDGTKRLRSYQGQGGVTVDMPDGAGALDVGMLVRGQQDATGARVTAEVTKCVLAVRGDLTSVSYEARPVEWRSTESPQGTVGSSIGAGDAISIVNNTVSVNLVDAQEASSWFS